MSTPLSPVSPLTPPYDLPPRPSSTDAIFRPRSQYTYRPLEPEQEPTRSQRCHSLQPPTPTGEHDNQQQPTPYPTLSLPPPPPSSSFSLHPWGPRSRSVSDTTPHQSTSPMLSTTTTTTVTTTQAVTTTTTTQGNRLIWLESEKLWFLKPLPSESSPFLTDEYGMAPRPTHHSQYTPHHPSAVRTDYRCASTTETYDIPPPYERHIYDRPLPPLPAEDRQTGGLYGSRWTAVARRRANRSALG
ncbi:hypothetical protein ASPCADRAFT_206229 [Aspergillus carbonarius ITEM 5010]|uniref:Uncharacterized protein n=1 Tax=Aspergillus carbonarius (strain ITEM 5010) TaxID=602072 RepID=A0A1R3RSF1_ASPC5|nr:hypothetical protein ASPCADRAFT_206229 [Aspergillus carbonarius ITEM 5010]